MAETVEPTRDGRGDEQHPAWALLGASRVQSSPPGAVLFDSEVRHQHYVVVRLSRVSRKRGLHHDWLHGEGQVIELAMSEAQWASFVSSMNVGEGVPCTVLWEQGAAVPGMPHESRLQESVAEVRGAADEALAQVREAMEAYKGKKTVANLRALEAAIANAPSNMAFAASSLTEHSENVVQKARADIEAMVTAKAKQLGLEPGVLPELPVGAEEQPGDG